jgi:hypothetical protein
VIEKRKLVAVTHPRQTSQRHVYFQFRNDGDEAREGFYMTRKNWDEMQRPRTITITVEVGDLIPDADDHEQNLLDKIPSRMPQVPLIAPTGL